MRFFTAEERNSMKPVACAVLCTGLAMLGLGGCQKPGVTATCDRAAYWVGAEEFEVDMVREDYLASLEEAFALDPLSDAPRQGALAYRRLWDLERFCWALRADE